VNRQLKVQKHHVINEIFTNLQILTMRYNAIHREREKEIQREKKNP